MAKYPCGWVSVLVVAVLGSGPLQGQARPTSEQTSPRAAAPASSAAAPLPAGLEIRRLILKDGSYQPVSKFEVHGDRVRYLSAERDEWEEVPYSLVDWSATEQYARQGVKRQPSGEAAAVDAEEQAERQKEEALTPVVAAGLRLPETGGVFLLDVFNRQPQLNELVQNGGEIKRNTGRSILRATVNPLAGQKQTVELQGQHARIQAHVSNPYFYVNVEEEPGPPAADAKDRFRIVRAESVPKKDVRVVGNIKVAMYGKVSQEEKFVPTVAETFSGPWLKITPAQPLEPGEYALVELLRDNRLNLFVWDFGVDPKAPENPGAWRSEPDQPASASAAKTGPKK
jgi:hypothetical protein